MVGEVTRRRKHKNSKFGCPNCKKRRVKCSEDLPQCLNCVKHKVNCGYLDYPEDKLEEMRAYKASMLNKDLLDDDKRDSVDSNIPPDGDVVTMDSPTRSFSVSVPVPVQVPNPDPNSNHSSISISNATKSASSFPLHKSMSNASIDADIDSLTLGFQPEITTNLEHPPAYTTNNFSNILNFASNSISQNFDNLLSETPDISIVYPVYSITNNQPLSPFGASSSNPNDYNSFGGFYNNTQDDIQQRSLLESLENPLGGPKDVLSEGGPPSIQSYLTNLSTPASTTGYNTSKKLPNAIESDFKFTKLKKVEKDYRAMLIDVVINLGPLVGSGRATLIQIRELYNLWLNSFLYKSYNSELMFSCLLNLTTNFLISNTFNNFNLLDSSSHSFINVTNVKNILIMISVKYYGITIKYLRTFLNKNLAPELCSSVSYILSLMSIYDPEATCNSTKCFSDGLFSVLKFNIDLFIKKASSPPLLIPIHLRLMHNIEKSIYFPGYNPTFLQEYQVKLIQFGKIMNQLTSTQLDMGILKLLKKWHSNLVDYIHVTLNEYLPILITNIKDNSIQQEILFRMTNKWVRLFPSRLLIITNKNHIIEKILYLFYKFFKKAMFAVLPQVKFYFLRDFDSPLMTDVFMFLNDTGIYGSGELDAPELSSFSTELKQLTSYLIRCLNYFQKRLQFLYKTIVYQHSTQDLFPIENRKDFIIDIEKLRKIFYNKLNIRETNIQFFDRTLIKPHHFPHVEDSLSLAIEQTASPEAGDAGEPDKLGEAEVPATPITIDDGEDLDVNYLTLTPMGFLENDVIDA